MTGRWRVAGGARGLGLVRPAAAAVARLWRQPGPGGALLAWALALLLGAVLASDPVRERFGHGRTDRQMALAAPTEPLDRVLVVDIDDDSVRALNPRFGAWPMRRDVYALLGGYLFDAGATAVVFNLVFADEREGDAAFGRFLAEAPGPVVLAASSQPYALLDGPPGEPLPAPSSAAPHGCETLQWASLSLPRWPSAPGGAASTGMISMPFDADGQLRTVPLLHAGADALLPALPLAIWLAVHRVPLQALRCEHGELRAGEAGWPIDAAGRLWPRFGQASAQPPQIPLSALAPAALGAATAPADAALRERIRGRVVVIGSSAGLGDSVRTPLGQQSATGLHASVYEALEGGRVYQPPRRPVDAAWLAVTLLPLAAAWRRRRHVPSRDILWCGVAAGLLFGLDTALVLHSGQLSHLGWPAAALGAFALLSLLRWRGAQVSLQDRLERERAAADEANRLKSEFLAHMSHEIRTPMNALLGAAELLAGSSLDEQQRRHVELFRAAGGHLMEILNDLLDLSKIEAGQLDLGLRAFSLSQLVASQVAMFDARAAQKGLVLRTTAAPDLPEVVLGDPKRLAQVLRNLISNAIKFTPAGSVTLTLGWGEGGRLRFEVRDTGIGIPADRLGAIFQPFTQSDGSITRRFGGTGLGLTISKRLVELMGGTLDVHSQEGQGSRFGIELLLPRSSQPPVVDWDDSGPGLSLLSPPKPRPMHILLADDNRYNVLLVQAFLEDGGHRLEVVGDGRSAVERYRRGGCDAVLMDVQMPVMDGHAATRAIRELERVQALEPVPVIALTANAQPGEAEAALQAGCSDYLAKPFTRAQLLAVLSRHAGRGPMPSAPPRAGPTPAADPRIARLAALEGAQVEAARRRLGERSGLYEQVLDEVLAPLRRYEAQLEQALARTDRFAATRHAHDLKGLALTIGVVGLADAAQALEGGLAQGAPVEALQPLRAEVSRRLAACIDALTIAR